MTGSSLQDWTTGEQKLVYQRCASCQSKWYFRRAFCPHCGASDVLDTQASGKGEVHALTLVTRAPTEELRVHAPYLIVLVDADEGFRLMAHGEPSLAIGSRVRCGFKTPAGKLLSRNRYSTSSSGRRLSCASVVSPAKATLAPRAISRRIAVSAGGTSPTRMPGPSAHEPS